MWNCRVNFYRVTAYLMVHLLPARWWYPTALLFAKMQTIALCPFALSGIYPYRQDIDLWKNRKRVVMATLLDTWMKRISAFRRPFSIPARTSMEESIREMSRDGKGLILCTVHCFLDDAALRPLAELGLRELTIVTLGREYAEGCPVWGMDRKIPTIYADNSVLLKARSILQRGGSIIILLDRVIGGSLEANMLRLACSIGSRAIFGIPELQPNGEILLYQVLTPAFANDTEAWIQGSLHALRTERDRVLQFPSTEGKGEAQIRTSPVAPAGISDSRVTLL